MSHYFYTVYTSLTYSAVLYRKNWTKHTSLCIRGSCTLIPPPTIHLSHTLLFISMKWGWTCELASWQIALSIPYGINCSCVQPHPHVLSARNPQVTEICQCEARYKQIFCNLIKTQSESCSVLTEVLSYSRSPQSALKLQPGNAEHSLMGEGCGLHLGWSDRVTSSPPSSHLKQC